jgi:hypothetical protein
VIFSVHYRDIGNLSELLKSKHEEGESYLSEIEVCILSTSLYNAEHQ